MWLAKQTKAPPSGGGADMGVTTIAGDRVGVITRGEVRDLPVYGPGGYLWAPGNGEDVLVVRGGPGGEEQCVAGMKPADPPVSVQPGEVCIFGPKGNAIYLRQDGSVEIRGGEVAIYGNLRVNGEPYQPCSC